MAEQTYIQILDSVNYSKIDILLKSCTFMKFKSPCMYCVDDENEMHIK